MLLESLLTSCLAGGFLRAKIDALILHHLLIIISDGLLWVTLGPACLTAARSASASSTSSPSHSLLMIYEAQSAPITALLPTRNFGSRLVLDEAQAIAALIGDAITMHRRLVLDQTQSADIAHACLSNGRLVLN